MNILVVSWRDPKHPNAGGAEQVMHEHVKGWIKAGHKISLFSSRVKSLPKEETYEGVKIIRRGDQYLGVKVKAFFFWLKNKNNFDFVVDQFHGIPFFTPLYVKKPKLAVLQEVTKEIWFLNHFPFPANYLIGLLGFLSEPLIFFLYRKTPFMVGSSSAKDDLIKMGINRVKISIVPHGVILSKVQGNIMKEKIKTITYLGALTKDKGVEDAIKMFSLLSKKGKFQFWVIGKGDKKYIEHLVLISKESGIGKNIRFWGYVDDIKKFELLAKSHILVNPSTREGWGLVNIEANAMQTPVISYRSPGLIDSVKDGFNGLIVKHNLPDDLADGVLGLFENPEKFGQLQKTSYQWSQQFSWGKSRLLSLKLIESIAK
jgi:glycosyltransferase involved in cell wall biosynthesis